MPLPRPNPRIRVRVVREDRRTLIVNKMPGLVTEPGIGHRDDSLLNGLFALDGGRLAPRLARLGEGRDWGLLHRLDRLTSGLLVVGLEIDSYERLRDAFAARRIAKTYLAIARGDLPESGEITAPLADLRRAGQRASVIDAQGKPALTRYRTLHRAGRYALVECELVTGRLHQIRVHLASIGAPVAGEPLYEMGGRPRPPGPRPSDPHLCLHAWKLGFDDPIDPSDGTARMRISVTAPVPRRFREFAHSHDLPLPEAAEENTVE